MNHKNHCPIEMARKGEWAASINPECNCDVSTTQNKVSMCCDKCDIKSNEIIIPFGHNCWDEACPCHTEKGGEECEHTLNTDGICVHCFAKIILSSPHSFSMEERLRANIYIQIDQAMKEGWSAGLEKKHSPRQQIKVRQEIIMKDIVEILAETLKVGIEHGKKEKSAAILAERAKLKEDMIDKMRHWHGAGPMMVEDYFASLK